MNDATTLTAQLAEKITDRWTVYSTTLADPRHAEVVADIAALILPVLTEWGERGYEYTIAGLRTALADATARNKRLEESLDFSGRGDVPKGWDDAITRAEKAEAEVSRLRADGERLRMMFAVCFSGAKLYADDGELQDNTQQPFIDFKRDSIDELQAKIRERNQRFLDAARKEATK